VHELLLLLVLAAAAADGPSRAALERLDLVAARPMRGVEAVDGDDARRSRPHAGRPVLLPPPPAAP
jgi:hypothetical protein